MGQQHGDLLAVLIQQATAHRQADGDLLPAPVGLAAEAGPQAKARHAGAEAGLDLPAPLLQRFDQFAAAAAGSVVVEPLRGSGVGLAALLVLAVLQPQVVPHQSGRQMAGFGAGL